MSERALAVFVKAPVLGRVKTRLARDIGWVSATAHYRCWTAAALRAGTDPHWRLVLAATPDHSVRGRFLAWEGADVRLPQGAGGLGERMARVFARLGPGPSVIVGSDIPGLCRADLTAAFARLRRADVVLGPAPDGGYWLIGLRRRILARALKKPIRWSSVHALADTLTAFGPGVRTAFLRTQSDIDTGEDWAAYRSVSRGRISTRLHGR